MNIPLRMIQHETQAHHKGLRFVFGVDEAGCGPLAGPVVAAAVHLTSFDFEHRIDDSKKMTHKAREKAFGEIWNKAYVGIGIVSEAAIDQINILNAAQHAMEYAVFHLLRALPQELKNADKFQEQVMLLIDGNKYRCQLPFKFQTIVGGDGQSLSIACASIVAKVYRDRLMERYGRLFPEYGFQGHKGYPTKAHLAAIKTHGPSQIHRRTFAGVL